MPLVVTHGGGEWAQGLGLILGAVAGRKQAKRDDEEYALEREKAEHEARKLEMEIEGLERKEADRKRIVDYERLKIARAGSQVATGSMAGTAPATPFGGGASRLTSVPGGAAPMPAIPAGVYEDMSSLPSFTGGQIGVDFENVWKPIDLEVLSNLQSVKAIEDFKADMTAQQDQKVLEYDRNKVIAGMNGLKRLVASSVDAEGLTVEIDGFIQELSGAVDRTSLLAASRGQVARHKAISDAMQTEYMRDTVWKPWFDRTMADIRDQVYDGTLSEEAGNDLMKQLLADNESVVRDGEDPRLFMRGLNAREMAALRKSLSDHQRALTASQAQVQQLSSVTAQALSAPPPTPGAAWADVSSEDQESVVSQATESVRTAIASADGPVDPDALVAETVDRLLSEKGFTAEAVQMQKLADQVSESLLETPSNKEVNKRVREVGGVIDRATEMVAQEAKSALGFTPGTQALWGEIADAWDFVQRGDTVIAKTTFLHKFIRAYDEVKDPHPGVRKYFGELFTRMVPSAGQRALGWLDAVKDGTMTYRAAAKEAAKEAAKQYKALPREEVRDWARGLGLTETQGEPAYEHPPRGAEDLPPAEVEPQGRGEQAQTEEEMRAERLAFARWERRRPPRKAEDRPPAEIDSQVAIGPLAEEQGRGEQVQAEEEMRKLASRRAGQAGYPAKVAAKAEEANYDYDNAKAAGLKPDTTGHWPSRVPNGPNEGLILKDVGHPTFWGETFGEELRRRYKFYAKDGRLWSFKEDPGADYQPLHSPLDVAEFVRQIESGPAPSPPPPRGPSPQRAPRGGGIE